MKRPRFSLSLSLSLSLMLGLTASSPPAESIHEGASPSAAVDGAAQLTLTEMTEKLDSGEVRSVDLVELYLSRIESDDDTVNSLVAVNEHALEEAEAADAARDDGTNGPLAGVPFVVKDNIDVAGMPSAGGSVALTNNYPEADAEVVRRLTEAGAIVLGRANMSELAASYGMLGYSSHGGQTVNPFNTSRDTSGSSSGSAAAVAAGFAPLALGTDTSGSVRGPAATTGLVGLRPTMGLVSRSGVIPLALSFDTVGPLARSATDAALTVEVLAGEDPQDEATGGAQAGDYADSLDDTVLEDVRIGVVDGYFGGDAEMDAAVEDALETMSSAGADVVDVDLGEDPLSLWDDIVGPVGDAEFATQFEDYLASAPDGVVTSLEDVIEISGSTGVDGSASPVNPARIEGMEVAQEARDEVDSDAYAELVDEAMPAVREHVYAVMEDDDVDVLYFPTMACPASPLPDVEDPDYSCASEDPYVASYLAPAAGLPEITFPVGQDDAGLPLGASFLAAEDDEQLLLDLVHSWEALAEDPPVPEEFSPVR